MAEDGIPEILAEQRLGHDVPGMRGLYTHVTQAMRENLTAALQARWETSLRDRAALDPHSPVPLLNNLLAPYRAVRQDAAGHRAPRLALAGSAGTGKARPDLPNSSQHGDSPYPERTIRTVR
jgi:hypothetical protein